MDVVRSSSKLAELIISFSLAPNEKDSTCSKLRKHQDTLFWALLLIWKGVGYWKERPRHYGCSNREGRRGNVTCMIRPTSIHDVAKSVAGDINAPHMMLPHELYMHMGNISSICQRDLDKFWYTRTNEKFKYFIYQN